MKVGKVVYIRVNPKDCMGCIDVAQKVGLVTTGMSFAQVVSLALSSLLTTAREGNLIPTREGYEYTQMIHPWGISPRVDARKLQLTKAVELMGSDAIVPAIPSGVTQSQLNSDPHKKRIELRIKELHFQRDAAPDSWDEEKQAQLIKLNDELMDVGEFDPSRKR